MNKMLLIGAAFVGAAAWADIPVTFPDAASGTVTLHARGRGDVIKSFSNPVKLAPGGLYGWAYAGREIGEGLMLSGIGGVNVDRRCPDQGWYNYRQVFHTAGTNGAPCVVRFHFGHYHGEGEFLFQNWRLVPLAASYATAHGLTLGHGEAVVGNRYTFETAFAGVGRVASRPFHSYRGAVFNSTRWNILPGSEIVYRHALAGRQMRAANVTLTCIFKPGAGAMAVEASNDGGATWQAVGTVAELGLTECALPATLFPADEIWVRFRGLADVSLQIGQYAYAATVDGAPVTCYGSTVYRETDTGAVFAEIAPPVFAATPSADNARRIAAVAGAHVWCAISDLKVFRNTPLPAARAKGLEVALAANESESVQLVVKATGAALADVRATSSALVAPGGATLPESCVSVRRVGYVTVKTPTDETGACGLWPDPLLPQDEAPLAVAAGDNQPLWITVRTPKTAPAGRYTGTVTLTLVPSGGGAPRTLAVPLAVEVFDFALPDRLTCETAFGFAPHRVATFHRVAPGSVAHDRLLEQYLELFADYRLTVYRWGKGERPRVTWKNAADPATAEPVFDWRAFDDAVTELRGRFGHNALRIAVEGLGTGFQRDMRPGVICGVGPTNAHYQTLMGRYLGGVEAHLKEKGWLESAYVYWVDEPQPSVLDKVLAGMMTLRRHAPGLRRMLTYPATRSLWEGVNLWNPRLDEFYKNDFAATRAEGRGDFWWYICCGPRAPYPTEFIDHAGHELRTWLWMTWAKGVSGVLVWETSLWTSKSRYPDSRHPQNPYEDAMSWSSSGGVWGNGDGRFVYPPLRACTTPHTPDMPAILDAPNPSYRLAVLRDGLEDFEYLAQLKRVAPQHPLLTVPTNVFERLNRFNPDPVPLRAQRLKVARELARLKGGVPRTAPAPCVPVPPRTPCATAAQPGAVYDLVCLGDELVAGLGTVTEVGRTLNLACANEAIEHVLGRVEAGALDGFTARGIVVMAGTHNRGCRPADMAAGMAKLLAAIRARQPQARIALYATLPCTETWRNLRNASANRHYAALADGAHIVFRDLSACVDAARFADGMKPDPATYKVWRADLKAVFK